MRIGIFGGSFDPIHQGHLILAEACREQVELDQVWFMPCAVQPHKNSGARATDRQRMEMIELAIAGHDGFSLSKIEIERGGTSYTVDTLKQIRESNSEDQLFLLMGDDSLESFESWREPQTICELAVPVIVNRPGSGKVDLSVLQQFVDGQRFELFQSSTVQSPMIEISSSNIRSSVADEKSIRYQIPRSVQKYIEINALYR
jgi:nicotinate-nucleotide adenylyltransferase